MSFTFGKMQESFLENLVTLLINPVGEDEYL
jgi:hypothetical protein